MVDFGHIECRARHSGQVGSRVCRQPLDCRLLVVKISASKNKRLACFSVGIKWGEVTNARAFDLVNSKATSTIYELSTITTSWSR